jgi:truncated hemoglobin YjbI
MAAGDHLPFAFQLVARGGNPDGALVLAAPTESERDAWINCLSTALVDAAETTSASGAADALTPQLAAVALS